ncbi:Ubiquitin-conjugating enzyme E2 36 [Platanthera zijinensis]|uniref:Ubiquitin-conjugating enzyme E2 36 n=1 Tax=Platanthera zijinensis TaxID=2320716 RepID=A0AAP0BY31_9ASPA
MSFTGRFAGAERGSGAHEFFGCESLLESERLGLVRWLECGSYVDRVRLECGSNTARRRNLVELRPEEEGWEKKRHEIGAWAWGYTTTGMISNGMIGVCRFIIFVENLARIDGFRAPGISTSPSEENMCYFNVMILGPSQPPYEEGQPALRFNNSKSNLCKSLQFLRLHFPMARKKNSTAARAAGGSRRPPPASKIPAEDAAAQHLRNQNSRLITEAVELRRELERLRAMRASINSGVPDDDGAILSAPLVLTGPSGAADLPMVEEKATAWPPAVPPEAPPAGAEREQGKQFISELDSVSTDPPILQSVHGGVVQSSSSPLASTDEVEILEEKLNSGGEEDLCEVMSTCSAAAAAQPAQAGHQQLHEEEKKDEMMKPGNPAGAKKESKFWIFKWRKCAGIALALIIPVVLLVVFLF